jgi:hypothetical protein
MKGSESLSSEVPQREARIGVRASSDQSNGDRSPGTSLHSYRQLCGISATDSGGYRAPWNNFFARRTLKAQPAVKCRSFQVSRASCDGAQVK